MTLKKEVKEIINRNFGDVKDTTDTIDQMIQIFSLLKEDQYLNPVFSLLYDTMAIHLQALKTEFQVRKIDYNLEKNNGEL